MAQMTTIIMIMMRMGKERVLAKRADQRKAIAMESIFPEAVLA